ncbi:transposable element Tc1 transposase [Trichonephila clavipes]|nr:transposable element Tc1 transposase [Trichonephila clavipes]
MRSSTAHLANDKREKKLASVQLHYVISQRKVIVKIFVLCHRKRVYHRMPDCRQRRHFQQTDDFMRGMVIGLRREGWSFRQIAADTNQDVSTVHRLWRRWLAQGNVARSRGPGAARVTSAHEDACIRCQAVVAPQATSTSILQHVQDTLDVPSTRTISRRWVESGLRSQSAQNTSINSTA